MNEFPHQEQDQDISLTLLYAPGHNVKIVQKALASRADIVVFDLEDAVPGPAKHEARTLACELLSVERVRGKVQVRINSESSPWREDDLELLNRLHPSVEVRIPKVQSSEDIALLRNVLPDRKLHALLESALGVENAFEIAQSGVSSISLGEADLRSDLGIAVTETSDEGLAWARSRIINASNAAGLKSPMMSVFTNVHDHKGLLQTSQTGRSLGFLGRGAIHPAQLPGIIQSFLPDQQEVKNAQQLLSQLEEAKQRSSSVVVLENGQFVDPAMVNAAEKTVLLDSLYRNNGGTH